MSISRAKGLTSGLRVWFKYLLTGSTIQLWFTLKFHLRTEAKMYSKCRVKHGKMDKLRPVNYARNIIRVAEGSMFFAVGNARV